MYTYIKTLSYAATSNSGITIGVTITASLLIIIFIVIIITYACLAIYNIHRKKDMITAARQNTTAILMNNSDHNTNLQLPEITLETAFTNSQATDVNPEANSEVHVSPAANKKPIMNLKENNKLLQINEERNLNIPRTRTNAKLTLEENIEVKISQNLYPAGAVSLPYKAKRTAFNQNNYPLHKEAIEGAIKSNTSQEASFCRTRNVASNQRLASNTMCSDNTALYVDTTSFKSDGEHGRNTLQLHGASNSMCSDNTALYHDTTSFKSDGEHGCKTLQLHGASNAMCSDNTALYHDTTSFKSDGEHGRKTLQLHGASNAMCSDNTALYHDTTSFKSDGEHGRKTLQLHGATTMYDPAPISLCSDLHSPLGDSSDRVSLLSDTARTREDISTPLSSIEEDGLMFNQMH